MKRKHIIKTLIFCAVVIFFRPIFAATTPMIVDTDMGTDDWLALSYLLKNPAVDIKAISIVTTGESDCKPGIAMVGALLKLSHHQPIPVACGSTKPIHGNKQFPAWFRSLINHHFNLKLPTYKNKDVEKSAVNLMYRTLLRAHKKITILAIGPLTNLALLLQKHPDIKKQIQRLYILGGAINVPGNIQSLKHKSHNKVAEWNVYIDAYAAKRVLTSGVPITLVSLDACNQVRLDMSFYHTLTLKAATPIAHFVQDVLTKNVGFIKTDQFYFWDPLAAAISVNNGFYTAKATKVAINLTSGTHYANVYPSPNGANIQWIPYVNAKKFKQIYLKQLNS